MKLDNLFEELDNLTGPELVRVLVDAIESRTDIPQLDTLVERLKAAESHAVMHKELGDLPTLDGCKIHRKLDGTYTLHAKFTVKGNPTRIRQAMQDLVAFYRKHAPLTPKPGVPEDQAT